MRTTQQGTTLLDALFALALIGTLLALGLPAFGQARARARGEGAARFLLTLCRSARYEAARRGATVGLRFDRQETGVGIRAFVDGDGDGISVADVTDGTDPPLGGTKRVEDDFPGVAIAVREPLPGIDGSAPLTVTASAIQVGTRNILSFTPDGAASGGTVYLAAEHDTAYAVRVHASTGRARALRYDRAAATWGTP